jgi:hypothetical protein
VLRYLKPDKTPADYCFTSSTRRFLAFIEQDAIDGGVARGPDVGLEHLGVGHHVLFYGVFLDDAEGVLTGAAGGMHADPKFLFVLHHPKANRPPPGA